MSNIKFLHISDDEKFIDSAIELFESSLPNRNIYLINGKDKNSIYYVKIKNENIKVFPYFSKNYCDVINEFHDSILFVHGLSDQHKIVLAKVGKHRKVFLNSWGKDIYLTEFLQSRLYKEDTRKLIEDLQFCNNEIVRKIKSSIKWILFPNSRVRSTEQYLKYVDFMSTVVKEDFNLLSQAYPKETKHLKYIQFNYGGFLPKSDSIKIFGENLLIGNSANYENNHIESFNLIKDIEIGTRLVIVPLSYGGNKKYISKIIQLGEYYFGENFNPITEFMTFEKYDAILSTIGFALMNHSRQHAMGNIFNLLYKGVKIFMDPENSATKAMKRINIVIENTNKINAESFFIPLPNQTQKKNRKIIVENYSNEVLQKKTKNLIELLSSLGGSNY